jgi:hypothetical protein
MFLVDDNQNQRMDDLQGNIRTVSCNSQNENEILLQLRDSFFGEDAVTIPGTSDELSLLSQIDVLLKHTAHNAGKRFVEKLQDTSTRVQRKLAKGVSAAAVHKIAILGTRYLCASASLLWGCVLGALDEEKQNIVVAEDPYVLLNNPSTDIQHQTVYWSAVKNNVRMLCFVPLHYRTTEMIRYAVSQDNSLMKYLETHEKQLVWETTGGVEDR